MARSKLGMGDRPGSYSRMSEDKVCRKDMCWSVRIVCVLVKLSDVSGTGLWEAGCYNSYLYVFGIGSCSLNCVASSSGDLKFS